MKTLLQSLVMLLSSSMLSSVMADSIENKLAIWIEDDAIPALKDRGLPSESQILQVQSWTLFSNCWNDGNSIGSQGSECDLRLTGVPTEHSDVREVWVHFISNGRFQQPSYDRAERQLDLYMPLDRLPPILQGMDHADHIICWAGFWKNSFSYGDIQISGRMKNN